MFKELAFIFSLNLAVSLTYAQSNFPLLSEISPKQHSQIPNTEKTKIYKAVGFQKKGQRWLAPCEKVCSTSIPLYRDLNKDSRPEAFVFEVAHGLFYGNTDMSFTPWSQQKNGKWQFLVSDIADPVLLNSTGKFNYPDLYLARPDIKTLVFAF